MNVAEQLVAQLVDAGVRRIYGIVGDSLNPIVDAVRKTGGSAKGGIDWVHVRHEEAAAFAAAAEAQLTGELSVCAGSCGPGNLHLINGLYDAQRSGAPVLAIASHIPSVQIGQSYFQETHPDRIFEECSVYNELISSAAQSPRTVNSAIRHAGGLGGVAVITLPGDVSDLKAVEHVPTYAPARPATLAPNPADIDEAAALLNRADKVAIFVGAGVEGAHDEVIALADALATGPEAFSGRVLYYGTPAEESDAGKELMARAGAFERVDAAIMVHPYFMDVADQAWLGRRECRVTYTGVSAHASSHPFMGRNAPDAANRAPQGLGLLRQQIPGSDRIHAIIDHGGDAPNLIPASASLHINIRSKHAPTLRALSRRVEEVLRGAALMAGVSAEVTWDSSPMTMPVRTNRPLLKRWVSAQRSVGRHPYPPGTVSDTLAASTDFGNVSLRVPGIHPLIQIAPEGTGMHTVEFAHCADTPAAVDAALGAAFGLASVALDFLVDDELADAVRADFEASGGAVDVEGYFSNM